MRLVRPVFGQWLWALYWFFLQADDLRPVTATAKNEHTVGYCAPYHGKVCKSYITSTQVWYNKVRTAFWICVGIDFSIPFLFWFEWFVGGPIGRMGEWKNHQRSMGWNDIRIAWDVPESGWGMYYIELSVIRKMCSLCLFMFIEITLCLRISTMHYQRWQNGAAAIVLWGLHSDVDAILL